MTERSDLPIEDAEIVEDDSEHSEPDRDTGGVKNLREHYATLRRRIAVLEAERDALLSERQTWAERGLIERLKAHGVPASQAKYFNLDTADDVIAQYAEDWHADHPRRGRSAEQMSQARDSWARMAELAEAGANVSGDAAQIAATNRAAAEWKDADQMRQWFKDQGAT